jgi:hypothetical protein
LEGIPTTKMNSRILAEVMDEARKFCGFNEVHLIEPMQRPIEYIGEYPFGKPSALPAVICIVELRHLYPCRDKKKDFSCIIWFQQDYAFPIDTEILQKIKNIPFSKLCEEFNY